MVKNIKIQNEVLSKIVKEKKSIQSDLLSHKDLIEKKGFSTFSVEDYFNILVEERYCIFLNNLRIIVEAYEIYNIKKFKEQCLTEIKALSDKFHSSLLGNPREQALKKIINFLEIYHIIEKFELKDF